MTTIGTFTPARNGFQGKIKTLTLDLTKVTLEPVTSENASAPAYRVIAGGIELGAAWERTAKESGRVYHQIRLDDPSFAGPVFANLIADEDGRGYSLIWNRPKRQGTARPRRASQGRASQGRR